MKKTKVAFIGWRITTTDYLLIFLNFFFSQFLRFDLGGGQFGIDRLVTSRQIVSTKHTVTLTTIVRTKLNYIKSNQINLN